MRHVIEVVAHTFEIRNQIDEHGVVFRIALAALHSLDMVGNQTAAHIVHAILRFVRFVHDVIFFHQYDTFYKRILFLQQGIHFGKFRAHYGRKRKVFVDGLARIFR